MNCDTHIAIQVYDDGRRRHVTWQRDLYDFEGELEGWIETVRWLAKSARG